MLTFLRYATPNHLVGWLWSLAHTHTHAHIGSFTYTHVGNDAHGKSEIERERKGAHNHQQHRFGQKTTMSLSLVVPGFIPCMWRYMSTRPNRWKRQISFASLFAFWWKICRADIALCISLSIMIISKSGPHPLPSQQLNHVITIWNLWFNINFC